MIGIIGGTGVYEIVTLGEEIDKKFIKTPYGNSPEVSIFKLHGKEIAFMPRHTKGHSIPPHMVNYRANVYAMKKLGVDRIIATNAVGSLERNVKPGDFVIPHDFIDFTKFRNGTFYDDRTVHIDVTEPYCNELRNNICSSGNVVEGGVYICTEGPRFETPAEIQMFHMLGGTIVGMTGIPEAVLARELEICYASISTVSNYAASISPNNLTIDEVFEIMDEKKHDLINLVDTTVSKMEVERSCNCRNALEGAEI
jgi:5'-methylthioinosine phosphorylase